MAKTQADLISDLERMAGNVKRIQENGAAFRAAQSLPEPEPAPRSATVERPGVVGQGGGKR